MKTPEEFLVSNGFTLANEIDRSQLIAAFMSEMEKGLRGEKSSLMMIPTYVGTDVRVPSGARVAVLDAGGTNFRGAVVSFPARIEHRANQPMPGTHGTVDAESFYRTFADEVARLRAQGAGDDLGWCFSYPAEATAGLDARLVAWTKGVDVPGVVGQYVGRELSSRLGGARVAVVNDTVATLLAAKAAEASGARAYSAYIGFILGTGTNCAYVERNANIAKLPDLPPDGSMIVNAESGGFGRLPCSTFDAAVNSRTSVPDFNIFEKQIAGAYLGSIGLEIFRAAAKAGFFSRRAAGGLAGLGALETRDLSDFCAAYSDGRANPLASIFAEAEEAKMARRLALPVFERAAVLTAVHLAAFAIKSGGGAEADEPVAISADGSTFYRTRAIPFAASVRRELDEMLVKRRNIHYEILPQIEDAPLIGAAIAALSVKGQA